MPRSRSRAAPAGGPVIVDLALLERWALAYLARYASSAGNLRRILQRRVQRLGDADGAAAREARVRSDRLIDALVARYQASGLIDDAAYAAGRARRGLAQGHSLYRMAAGLAAKGVGAADAAAALAALREAAADPELAAACAFARRRRLGPYRRGMAAGDRELAAFARAGFNRRIAQAVLGCIDEDAVAALLLDDARN